MDDSIKALADMLLAAKSQDAFSHRVGPRSASLSHHARAKPAKMLEKGQGWDSENWKWGSPDGEAAAAVARVREKLATQENRERFMKAMDEGRADIEDIKVALALMIEGCPEEDNRMPRHKQWKPLLEDMKNGNYEGQVDGELVDGEMKLKAALNARMARSILKDNVAQKVVLAFTLPDGDKGLWSHSLNHFVEKGLPR